MSCVQAGEAETTFVRSGNPGYIVGEPLVAGKLNVTKDNKYLFGSLVSQVLRTIKFIWLSMVLCPLEVLLLQLESLSPDNHPVT